VGAQEVTYAQLIDMENLLPTYSYVGVGREGGKKAEVLRIELIMLSIVMA